MADLYSGKTVQVLGARQLRATLRAAGDDLTDLRDANRAAGDVVAGAGQSRAPRVSGRLAASVRASGTKTAAIVRAGNNRSTASAVPYGNPIHWGWFKRGIRPNPFLSLAAQATEPVWRKPYETALDKAIQKVKGL